MKYDIFISYKRRGSSSVTAAFIYDLLTRKGYSVFFDRKEIRQGKFDTQLFTHIQEAKDIIILLEDGSLASCFSDMKEAYKTDWFCMEIMHALENKKRIIPVLLEDYKMPSEKDLPAEMAALTKHNAISLDITELDEFYQKYLIDQEYLASKPRNIFLSHSDGEGVADFLFFSEGDCDIFEFGRQIGTIDANVDEEHPYSYPVKRSGEHKFRCLNNDTFEEKWITEIIESDTQKYVDIRWSLRLCLWDLTEEEIGKEEDPRNLYFWGKGLFEGTSKHDRDVHRAFLCMKRSAEMWNVDARDFLVDHVKSLLNKDVLNTDRIRWYEKAAEYGSDDAMELLGRCYDEGIDVPRDFKLALEYGTKALDLRLKKYGEENADVAMSYHNLGRVYALMERYNKSIECYQKAIKIREAVFGQDNAETANSYNNLTIVYIDKKNYKLALDACRAALRIRKNLLGEKNELTHLSYWQMGDIYSYMGDYEHSIAIYEQGLEIGSSNCAVALGKLYLDVIGDENSFEKAYDYLMKAVNMENAWAMSVIADLYYYGYRKHCLIDVSQAIQWYEKAAEGGNYYSMFMLGSYYQFRNDEAPDYEKSYVWYLKSSEGGSTSPLERIGDLYRMGCLDDPDHSLAFQWYSKAADADSPYGQSRLGDMYFQGHYVKKDYSTAFKWYMKAARQGYDTAYLIIGDMYFYGNGVDLDYQKAMEWYEKAADKGHPFSMFKVGKMFEEGMGVDLNYEEAFAWYQKAAGLGNQEAKDAIGDMYKFGNGVDQDYEKAYEWFLGSSSPYALAEIGDMYFNGSLGREADYQKAYEWYFRASQVGNSYAMGAIGHMYDVGLLGEVDMKKSFEWFVRAAEAGNPYAMRCLGLMYSNGEGIETDKATSYHWYVKAAEAGDSFAMRILGDMYRDGEGVFPDCDMAMEWYEKSVDEGDGSAAYAIAELYSGMYEYQGFEKDIDKCIFWHEKAFSLGHAYSADKLAELYLKGDDVEKNVDLALEWLTRASEVGSTLADNELGDLYLSGDNVEQDTEEAIRWYTKAAEAGNAYAMGQLGDCYYKPENGIQDIQTGFEWYSKAAEAGNDYAMFQLSFLYEKGDVVEKDVHKAIELCERVAELQLSGASYALHRLSSLYMENPEITDFQKALYWSEKYLEVCQNGLNSNDIGIAYNSVAWCYCELEDYSSAIEYAEKSVEFFEEGNTFSLSTAAALDTLGVALQGLGRDEEARRAYEKSFKVSDVFDDERGKQLIRERLEGLSKGALKEGN